MRKLVSGCAAALLMVGAVPLRAQEPDPAEAYGIYRPPPPPSDSAAPADEPAGTETRTAPPPDTIARIIDVPTALAADSAARDTSRTQPAAPATSDTAARSRAPAPDSVPDTTRSASRVPLEQVEIPAGDTSLTARMDVSRGGGLPRGEFPDLRESARLTGRYSVFLQLLERSGLAGALGDTVALTLLAPTDSAFARLPPADLERLRGDSAARARWAASLVLEGDRTMADLLRAGEVATAGGMSVRVTRGAGGSALAGAARIVQPDLIARHGRIHGVDRVTLPEPDTTATSAAP